MHQFLSVAFYVPSHPPLPFIGSPLKAHAKQEEGRHHK
jgi:hypothetical protein